MARLYRGPRQGVKIYVENFPTKLYAVSMTDGPEMAPDLVGRELKHVLRPLVRALIEEGVTAPALYALLKELYVDVASEAFAIDGKPLTDSRVSVLTGVHRKDVRNFRRRVDDGEGPAVPRVTVMTTVIGRWLADPKTTAADGSPKPLPRQARRGPSFDALVSAVSSDVRPRTILDELVRNDIVALDEETDMVSLKVEALITRDGEERFHFFARNIGDHMAAAVENILTRDGAAPFLERAVFYNNLRPASVDEIEARARALAGDLIAELNRMGYSRQKADARSRSRRKEDEARERFRFGVYFYRDDETAEDEG